MIGLMSLLFAFSFDILKYSEMSCIDAQTLIEECTNTLRINFQTEDADELSK